MRRVYSINLICACSSIGNHTPSAAIWKLSLNELRTLFFSNCLEVCTRIRFWSFVNIHALSMGQKSFVLSNYASKWKANNWQYHESCICHHFHIFLRRLKYLPFHLKSQVSLILLHLWRFLCQSEISFSTYELSYKILIRPIKPKKNMRCWMTQFSFY